MSSGISRINFPVPSMWVCVFNGLCVRGCFFVYECLSMSGYVDFYSVSARVNRRDPPVPDLRAGWCV